MHPRREVGIDSGAPPSQEIGPGQKACPLPVRSTTATPGSSAGFQERVAWYGVIERLVECVERLGAVGGSGPAHAVVVDHADQSRTVEDAALVTAFSD